LTLLIILTVSYCHASSCSFNGIELSGLTSKTDYTSTDGIYSYFMNICGLVNNVNAINAKPDASIIQALLLPNQRPEYYSFGSFNNGTGTKFSYINPTYPGVGIQITFINGDQCWSPTGNIPRTTHINLVCADQEEEIFKINIDQTTCTYTFTLHTKQSCPHRTSPCSFDGINLIGLNNNKTDYIGGDGKFYYYMNICGPSLHGYILNSSDASIIFKQGREHSTYYSLGSYDAGTGVTYCYIDETNPSIGIQMTYNNGDPCHINNKIVSRTTLVNLVCTTTPDSYFNVQSDDSTCTYIITFQTSLTCTNNKKSNIAFN
jgi:hypothetical protein